MPDNKWKQIVTYPSRLNRIRGKASTAPGADLARHLPERGKNIDPHFGVPYTNTEGGPMDFGREIAKTIRRQNDEKDLPRLKRMADLTPEQLHNRINAPKRLPFRAQDPGRVRADNARFAFRKREAMPENDLGKIVKHDKGRHTGQWPYTREGAKSTREFNDTKDLGTTKTDLKRPHVDRGRQIAKAVREKRSMVKSEKLLQNFVETDPAKIEVSRKVVKENLERMKRTTDGGDLAGYMKPGSRGRDLGRIATKVIKSGEYTGEAGQMVRDTLRNKLKAAPPSSLSTFGKAAKAIATAAPKPKQSLAAKLKGKYKGPLAIVGAIGVGAAALAKGKQTSKDIDKEF